MCIAAEDLAGYRDFSIIMHMYTTREHEKFPLNCLLHCNEGLSVKMTRVVLIAKQDMKSHV